MALYAYIRVSSEKQSYSRQEYQFKEYFARSGVDFSKVKVVEEKITSYTSFKQRAIYPILKNAQAGDIIYVCQLDRLGRTVEDIIQLVKYADSINVELWSVKDGMQITYKTQTGKMMLTLLAMVAEMERELRAERCQSGIDAAKEEIEKYGSRISRISGRVQTRWGNDKGCDMTAAQNASIEAKQDAAIRWREQSVAIEYVRRERAKGRGVVEITNSLAELYDMYEKKCDTDSGGKNPYATPKGCKPCKGVVSRWCRQMNPIVV